KLLRRLKDNDRAAAGSLTEILASIDEDGASPDMRFALLTSLRSRYEEPPPILKLGTIVAEDGDGDTRYWLCVQPVCDSVRLESSRAFPFLKLTVRTANEEGRFDFVIFDRLHGEYRRLLCSRKAFDMMLFQMDPRENSQSVKAAGEGSSWLFTRSGDSSPLRWVADLKTDHAYRIVDLFANEMRRVGLTESEWLRRMANQR
ncbi:MAG TPA: hypothetical protein VLQ45_00870, partial [Thermoanaerobaculia bacterium]|nr:hypothetical protein [Thermoanaerobaculia bacterium]